MYFVINCPGFLLLSWRGLQGFFESELRMFLKQIFVMHEIRKSHLGFQFSFSYYEETVNVPRTL